MKVLLISGRPKQGKTFAADFLQKRLDQLNILHTDELYCEFIEKRYPALLTNNLRSQVKSHYKKNAEAIRADWKDWLLERVSLQMTRCGPLIVEGWHVKELAGNLVQICQLKGFPVTHVEAVQWTFVSEEGTYDLAELLQLLKQN